MVKSACLFSLFFFFLLVSYYTTIYVVAEDGNVISTAVFHVGVVLDLTSNVGKIAESCISMALSDFYGSHGNYTTRIVLHTMDSENDVVVSASAALYLMENVEVQAIIGPQQSSQASFLIDLGRKAQVPIVTFSATSPSLSPLQNPYFVRTAIDDSTQVKAIAAIIQAFKWKEVVLIHEDTDYGNGLIPYFIDALQEIYVRVPYRSSIPLDANDDQILNELHKLTTIQTRVFIVHMSASTGSRLFINAKNAGMISQGYAWIVSDGLSSSFAHMDSKVINSMEGVLGVRPYIPESKELEEFQLRWKQNKSIGGISEPNIYGIWAYDTVWALAMAVEQVGNLDPQFLNSNNTNNLTDLSSLGFSTIGPPLLQAILNTRFKGLSGDFHLIKGQLKSSVFQIFNVIGLGERVIGYWTPTDGISRDLNTTNKKTNSDSMSDLKVIVWPGDTTTKPQGWAILTNDKEYMKILVPIKDGFTEFVTVERDNVTNVTQITGFCIEVFDTITSMLPFALSYEYQPYPLDGSVIDSYDDLIDQVYYKDYDAIVGDVSILWNRSLYVDFTIPFTDSGVQMVVAMQDDLQAEWWLFLKPLSLSLWSVALGGFFLIGGLICILELPNEEFGTTWRERIGTSLWFSFMTLIFAQREKINSNLTRIVLITWVFFVLILTQSYTASLSSMLTAQQLQPTITDVNVLRDKGYYVGYQDGSFVKNFLIQHLLFDESKLKNYTTAEDYHHALSNGTNNGGVAAIFDEIPYIQVFLSKYCNKYTTVGLTYSSEGFGFVFQKDSPLVPYMSMAILNITDNGTMDNIKNVWLENSTTCNNAQASTSSTQLGIPSFTGLLIIIGAVSVLSLFIHLSLLVWKHWYSWIPKMSELFCWIIFTYNYLNVQPAFRFIRSLELTRRGAEHMDEQGAVAADKHRDAAGQVAEEGIGLVVDGGQTAIPEEGIGLVVDGGQTAIPLLRKTKSLTI